MSGENSADGFPRSRPVLGDVTNRLGKRGLSLISDNLGNESGDGHGNHVNNKEGDSQFTHKVCRGVEIMIKEKCGIRRVVMDSNKGKRACVSPRPCSEINSLRGNVISGISKIPSEVKESNPFVDSLDIDKGNAVIDNVVDVSDASRDYCVSSVEGGCNNDEGRVSSEVVQSDPRGEELVNRVCNKDCKVIGADNVTLAKYGSIECSKLAESQVSRSFKLERCIRVKGVGSSNASAAADLIKACSCSFCVKAAYVWSDLHYQDIKGHMAALKKSQKEASIMVERSSRDKGIDKHSHEIGHKFLKLEADLTSQWRSLFLHMEDTLAREGSQLEEKLLTMKDVRENCKAELERINGMPMEKQ